MVSIKGLEEAVKSSLEDNGALGPIKASMRAEIYKILNGTSTKTKISNENLLINNLILEYLKFNNYNTSASVLTLESGQPDVGFNRDFLKSEFNITENDHTASVLVFIF
ncbi:hypothetical protein HELRODRAFT_169897 [Helobdella robusta]|uniref:FGFR1 oncogene partner (FOP) N-terminal dimerisation domain-containing protein n=1 Tax=Helobdella robusta TaxID=6412 RepID=T1F2F2_HELRO|nr:hypothetical protein HELRODRAFT_169897 [Helobdella robusta]ESO08157.1 hypothetical protein HELRODRAFT_169897 [Helobdella robusta]